jgi:hypothetical protein
MKGHYSDAEIANRFGNTICSILELILKVNAPSYKPEVNKNSFFRFRPTE